MNRTVKVCCGVFGRQRHLGDVGREVGCEVRQSGSEGGVAVQPSTPTRLHPFVLGGKSARPYFQPPQERRMSPLPLARIARPQETDDASTT